MSNLQQRQDLIKTKRMKTPWRNFVMEICSWYPLNLYKTKVWVSRYPETDRLWNIIDESVAVMEQIQNEYNDNLSFFSNYKKTLTSSNIASRLSGGSNENSLFCDSAASSKNCYLSFTCVGSENVFYSSSVKDGSSNVYNSVMVWNNSNSVYSSMGVLSSYQVFFSKYILNSRDIWYCSNLIGCNECIACNDLENQSYCIFNTHYSKDEYYKIKWNTLETLKIQAFQLSSIWKSYWSKDIHNSNFSIFSENVEQWYYTFQLCNAKNVFLVWWKNGDQDIYDVAIAWSPFASNYYGCINVWNGDNYYCSLNIHWWSNLYYCDYLINCSFCLGCIGLKNKSYCILNKQYTKEERYEKVDKIFSQMEKDGTLGQFFPATMNPFYFNDTAAYLIDPTFTKEEVTAKGYLWRDEAIKVDIPEWMEIVKTIELGNYEWFDAEWNRTINADILKKVIQDEQGNVYRIVKMEYDFLMKHGLPLPRKHWLERMKENFRIH